MRWAGVVARIMVVNAPFARAMLAACLTVLGALCGIVALLLAVLLAVDLARGENAHPVAMLVAGAFFAAVGLACPRLAKWIA